jgi:hypothetical protein
MATRTDGGRPGQLLAAVRATASQLAVSPARGAVTGSAGAGAAGRGTGAATTVGATVPAWATTAGPSTEATQARVRRTGWRDSWTLIRDQKGAGAEDAPTAASAGGGEVGTGGQAAAPSSAGTPVKRSLTATHGARVPNRALLSRRLLSWPDDRRLRAACCWFLEF